MRADKEELAEVCENDSTAVVEQKIPNSLVIFLGLFPFLSVLTVILAGLISNIDVLDMMKVGVLVFLLTTALCFVIRMYDNISMIKFSKSIILISYLVSMVLIMLQEDSEIYSFWMIGALLISMLIDSKIGLMVYFNLSFVLSITAYLNLEATIHLLIMGVLFALLSSSLRNKSTVIYAAIILLSTNITLSFLMNNFIFETNNNVNYLASFFSILAVLVTAFLLSLIYDRLVRKFKSPDEFAVSSIAIVDNSEDITVVSNEHTSDRSIRTSYELLLSENNELLLKTKEHSEALYKHSILIGDLSGRAAKLIGANEELARAGGYYHEIGKINGKNYIEEGLKLAEEYAFPDELKAILRQHSIKHDKPNFVEAAIVMISDNVASTIEYIDKSGNHNFTSDKIIDNIFKMRMDKGNFDNSGISVKDFKLLKEFYQNEYKTKNVEN
ncbi:MAG: HDIG domain-containing protein [Herbinix sp.]|nr:HDIG domain-containing protein [Herbinix sp.]